MKALFLKSATSPLVIKYVEFQDNETFVVRDEYTHELNGAYKASTEVFDQIDKLLERNNVQYADINRIYVASGPGSYTAARLLVTIVKTIVFLYPEIAVFDASLLAIGLQASMRHNVHDFANYGVSLARKNKYYLAAHTAGETQANQVVSTTELQAFVEASMPCFVNGVEMVTSFNLSELTNILVLEDWVAVSTRVNDVSVYEPYYLEEVNIG